MKKRIVVLLLCSVALGLSPLIFLVDAQAENNQSTRPAQETIFGVELNQWACIFNIVEKLGALVFIITVSKTVIDNHNRANNKD